MNNLTGVVDEEEQKIVLQTVVALEDFSRDESLAEEAKVWITKKEARLLWRFIHGLLHKIYDSRDDKSLHQEHEGTHHC
jgi:hypothetical protein